MPAPPIQPSASEAIVMPSWQTDRERFCRFNSQIAVLANGLFCAFNSSKRLMRTLTRENSAATKSHLAGQELPLKQY